MLGILQRYRCAFVPLSGCCTHIIGIVKRCLFIFVAPIRKGHLLILSLELLQLHCLRDEKNFIRQLIAVHRKRTLDNCLFINTGCVLGNHDLAIVQ